MQAVVGEDWFAHLNSMGIRSHHRITENFYVTRHGRTITAAGWPMTFVLESNYLNCIYYITNQQWYLSGSCIKNKEVKPELHKLVSFCKAEEALNVYKQSMKIKYHSAPRSPAGSILKRSTGAILEESKAAFHFYSCLYIVLLCCDIKECAYWENKDIEI